MRNPLLFAAVAACLSALNLPIPSAFAQGPVPTAQRATVVVLDVGAVFKQHNRFEQQMEIMKKEVADFENYIRQERDRVVKLNESLKDYNPGTPNYKQLEKQITQLQSDLQVEMQLKRRRFMEQEAKLYFNVYTEVKNAVAWFANEYGISLVLRYNSEDIDPSDRQSVLAGVNSPIVFQRELDITAHIIKKVNEGSLTPGVRENIGRRPALPPTRPR